MTMTVTQTRNEAGFYPCTVCGKQSLDWWLYPGGTCSQECARTLVIVEVGRELLKLLRVIAAPVYYTTPEGGLAPMIGPLHSYPAAEPAPHPTGPGEEPSLPWDQGAVDY